MWAFQRSSASSALKHLLYYRLTLHSKHPNPAGMRLLQHHRLRNLSSPPPGSTQSRFPLRPFSPVAGPSIPHPQGPTISGKAVYNATTYCSSGAQQRIYTPSFPSAAWYFPISLNRWHLAIEVYQPDIYILSLDGNWSSLADIVVGSLILYSDIPTHDPPDA